VRRGPLHFMLGRAAGPALTAAAGRTRLLRPLVERRLSGSSTPWLAVVAVSPTGKTMLVAGGTGMRAGRVAVANLVGTLARVLLIWSAGKAFPTVGETLAVLAPWIAAAGCVAMIIVAVVRGRRVLRTVRLRMIPAGSVAGASGDPTSTP
jgi:hypothetical protein